MGEAGSTAGEEEREQAQVLRSPWQLVAEERGTGTKLHQRLRRNQQGGRRRECPGDREWAVMPIGEEDDRRPRDSVTEKSLWPVRQHWTPAGHGWMGLRKRSQV